MWEDAAPHRYPHPSFIIDTEEYQASIYDTFLVDYLDLEASSLFLLLKQVQAHRFSRCR